MIPQLLVVAVARRGACSNVLYTGTMFCTVAFADS
jgi:hypothetical protein